MPVSPVLMVLYTNDAVEVRYTDGSRLHILPCGSAFSYYSPQDAHPIHGKFSSADYAAIRFLNCTW